MAEKHIEPTIDPSLSVGDDHEAQSALDAAFKTFSGDTPEGTPEATPEVTPKADVAEAAPAAEADPIPEPAPEPEPESSPLAEESVKRLPDTAPAAPTEETDPDLKAFDEVKLRADASQKTKDTFANLKQIAAERVKAAKAEVARLREETAKAVEAARQAALEEAKKNPALPEDLQKELEDLRQLRARVDVESDPKFKEQFDARRDANFEAIFGTLQSFGLKESELKVLRSLSEAEKIENITELAAKLPTPAKLKIEAKLFDNLNISDAREKALKDAREQAQKLFAERETNTKAQTEAAKQARQEAVAKFKAMDVFKKADISNISQPEERKRVEAANQFVDKLAKLFDEAVADETPAGQAENAFGLVLAHKLKADLDATTAKLAAVQKELDGIKKRSGIADKGRLVNTPSTETARTRATHDMDAGSALDEMAKSLGIA